MPKLHIVNTDAFQWLQNGEDMSSDGRPRSEGPLGAANDASGSVGDPNTFDVIVVDFPDPTNFAIGSSTPTPFIPCWHSSLSAAMRSFRPHRPWWRAKVSGLWLSPSNRLGCARHALPHERAQFWRVGLHHCQPPPLASAYHLATWPALFESADAAVAVRLPHRYGSRTRRGGSLQRGVPRSPPTSKWGWVAQ